MSAVRQKNRSFGRVFWESGWVGMCIFGHRTAREGPAPLLKIISVAQCCYFMFRRAALSLKLSFYACMTATAIDWLSQNKHTDFWVLVVSAVRPKNRSFGSASWESGMVGVCIFGHRTTLEKAPHPYSKLFPWYNIAISCSAGPLSV